MHLQSIYQLLLAATERPKVVEPHCDVVVREMVDLGLVDATLADGRTRKFSAINRLTKAGKRFVRVVEGQHCAVLNVYRRRKEEANKVVTEAQAAAAAAVSIATDTPPN